MGLTSSWVTGLCFLSFYSTPILEYKIQSYLHGEDLQLHVTLLLFVSAHFLLSIIYEHKLVFHYFACVVQPSQDKLNN
jgi:hypothetical protein